MCGFDYGYRQKKCANGEDVCGELLVSLYHVKYYSNAATFLKNRNTSLQSPCGLLTFCPIIPQEVILQEVGQ